MPFFSETPSPGSACKASAEEAVPDKILTNSYIAMTQFSCVAYRIEFENR